MGMNNAPEAPMYTGAPSTPVPDPTTLTTAALVAAIGALKEIVFTRLDGMDKAVSLFKDDITRVPTDTDKQIQQLKALMGSRIEGQDSLVNEKFAGVQQQFKERDTRVEQTAKDTKVAVDAALQAAEKAVTKQNEAFTASIAKSEAATSKQIDQQGQLLSTSTAGLNDKIDDLKSRLTRIEGKGEGISGSWIALIGAITIMGILVAVVFSFSGHTPGALPSSVAPQVIYLPTPVTPVTPTTTTTTSPTAR